MIKIIKLVLSIGAIFALYALPIMAKSPQISEMRYWIGNEEPVTIKASAGEPVFIPYNQTRRDLVVIFNYQVKDVDGNWSVPHRHLVIPPLNSCTQIPDNLTLTLSSHRGNVTKKNDVLKSQGHIDVDVKDLDPGIYNITGTFTNPINGELIGFTNTFVDIKPIGGNTLEGIYYWLNDSLPFMAKQSGYDERIPLKKTVDIPINSKDIPSLDYKLTVNDGVAEIAPNYKISVAFKNSRGFIADATANITDNSRRCELLPLWLEASKQHDTENAKSDTCYWYAFTGQNGDVVDFSARRPCRVKIYDPQSVLLDTALFTDNMKVMRCNIKTSGTHYIQVSEIDQSRQIFSTMVTYISGPTHNKLNQNTGNYSHTHDGLLMTWEDATEWKKEGGIIQLSKSNIDVSALNMEGFQEPYISDKSNLFRVYPGNVLQLKSKGYIEKTVFCVRNASGIILPKITSPNGNIEIDSLTNCVKWTGFSDHVVLFISQGQTDSDVVLPISRIFVTKSELNSDDVIFGTDSYDGTEYYPFNMLYLWSEGKLLASHSINESSKIRFDRDNIIVYSNNQTYAYTLENKIILTYEYSDITSSVDEIKINVRENNLVFDSLPAFVGIYSISGYTFFAEYVTEPDFSYPLDKLNPGVYIVKIGDKVYKIIIQ